MHHLTREVRFAVNALPDGQLAHKPTNSHAGFPALTGLGHYFTMRLTLAGPLDAASQYVLNIRDIDAEVRQQAIPIVERFVRSAPDRRASVPQLVLDLFNHMRVRWAVQKLESLSLSLSPFLSYCVCATEHPMVRLSQKFEFSATHRLHNPSLSDDENGRVFGKCNNPHGHGHNYEVQVTLRGQPNASGVLVDVPAFERIVAETVIDKFDHKNLNLELAEFRERIPSVENIAMVIYQLLKPQFTTNAGQLASVTVWETPKTWCEYAGE